MKNPRMLVVGAVAAASLMAAASASAAADVSSVTVEQAGKRKLEVVVETVHGAGAVAPTVAVQVGRRHKRLKTTWDPAASPTALVESSGYLRSRAAVGDTVTVSVRVCDADCTTTTYTKTVIAGDPAEYGNAATASPLPAGAVTAAQASAIALAVVPGSTLKETERTDDAGAVWEVKLRGTDGACIEVLITADGTIMRQSTRPARTEDHHEAIAPLPAGAVTAEQASAAAVAAVPGTVREVERTDDAGAVWKVKVNATDGSRHCVLVAADGTIVRDTIKS